MLRAAFRARRAWGACVGFESCPALPGRLVEGFTGPWASLHRTFTRPEGRFDCVVLAARTLVDVRTAVTLREVVPAATRVRIAIAEVPPWAAQPLPLAGYGVPWSRLTDLRISRVGRGWRVDARFAEPVLGGDVLVAVAHGLFGRGRHLAQPVAGLAGEGAAVWRPGDPNAAVSAPDRLPADRQDAPGCDLLLRVADAAASPGPDGGAVPVVARMPLPGTEVDLSLSSVSSSDAVPSGASPSNTWPSSAALSASPGNALPSRFSPSASPSSASPGAAVELSLSNAFPSDAVSSSASPSASPGGAFPSVMDGVLELPRPVVVPPVDEAVINPIGFRSHPTQPLATLVERGAGFAVVCGADTLVRLAPGGQITDRHVTRLRNVRGVRVPALAGRPVVAARIVAALAAAGIPVVADADPERDAVLGPELAGLLAAGPAVPLDNDLRREEFSVRLRRCALWRHGAVPRWREIARSAGVPVPADPLVSILLCTRRPEMVPFALRQMAGQRGVRAELIVGLHGCEAHAPLARWAADAPLPVTTMAIPAGVPFGEALNRMAAVAAGSFLAKVDDDDWYGPDHLADLLLAQLYSGADVVGAAAEFVYLEPLDVTIRRGIGTERFAALVAGGTMLVSRSAFEAVGGFRPLPRTVDGQLLQAVQAAGGRIYRTHGLNYILRRRSARAHTWQRPLPAFLDAYQEQWRGLVFNDLMTPEASRDNATARGGLPNHGDGMSNQGDRLPDGDSTTRHDLAFPGGRG